MRFLLLSLLICVATFATNVLADDPIELKMTSMKSEYQLGEIVGVRASFANKTKKPIELGGDSRNWAAIEIASDDNTDYKFYAGPPTGIMLDGYNFPTVVKARTTLTTASAILWNYAPPNVSNLSVEAARSYTEGRILTWYAFPSAGTYFIKYVALVHEKGVPVTYESEPLKVAIFEPLGNDSDVWNTIKGEPAFAYFSQQSTFDLRFHKVPQQEAVLRAIETIINKFPTSVYSSQFKKSLNTYKSAPKVSLYPHR